MTLLWLSRGLSWVIHVGHDWLMQHSRILIGQRLYSSYTLNDVVGSHWLVMMWVGV